jgi:glucose dehydrogenase
MSKRAAIILAVLTLLIGIVAGGWAVGLFYGRLTTRLIVGQLTAEASTTTVILKRLRAGNTTNAVELLEIKLDGDLIGLGAMLADPREFKRDPQYIKTIQMVRDYRTQFPRKSGSPEVDAGADKAFDLLNGQTNH